MYGFFYRGGRLVFFANSYSVNLMQRFDVHQLESSSLPGFALFELCAFYGR